MPTIDLDFLRLSHRPDLAQLNLRWTRPATSTEHRSGYEAALGLAKQENVSRWLIDLRSRGLAEPDDLRWILDTFQLALTAALPGQRPRLAYLVAPYHADLLRQRLADYMTADSLGAVVIRVFTEEQAAQEWLQSR